MATFGTISTNIGDAKQSAAVFDNTKIDITHFAIGDSDVNHIKTSAALGHEVYRATINNIEQDANDPNIHNIEIIIPANVGGFTIKEMGLIDANGDFIWLINVPPTYKPLLSEGIASDLSYNFKVIVTDTGTINLAIDPNIIIATRAWVSEQLEQGARCLEYKGYLTNEDLFEVLEDGIYIASQGAIKTPENNYPTLSDGVLIVLTKPSLAHGLRSLEYKGFLDLQTYSAMHSTSEDIPNNGWGQGWRRFKLTTDCEPFAQVGELRTFAIDLDSEIHLIGWVLCNGQTIPSGVGTHKYNLPGQFNTDGEQLQRWETGDFSKLYAKLVNGVLPIIEKTYICYRTE